MQFSAETLWRSPVNSACLFADCARIETWVTAALVVIATTLVSIAPASASDDPASSGVSRDRLLRIHALVEREIAAKDYSGVVTLVARDGHIVHFEAQGLADIEGGKPMTKDAVFRLASMSKVVTAVAVLILVEEGKIRLTDPVEKFLPAFKNLQVAVPDPGPSAPGAPPRHTLVPATHAITVRELLTPRGWEADRSARRRWRRSLESRGKTWLPK